MKSKLLSFFSFFLTLVIFFYLYTSSPQITLIGLTPFCYNMMRYCRNLIFAYIHQPVVKLVSLYITSLKITDLLTTLSENLLYKAGLCKRHICTVILLINGFTFCGFSYFWPTTVQKY